MFFLSSISTILWAVWASTIPLWFSSCLLQRTHGPSGRCLWRCRSVSDIKRLKFCKSFCYFPKQTNKKDSFLGQQSSPVLPLLCPRRYHLFIVSFPFVSYTIIKNIYILLMFCHFLSQPRGNCSSEELGLNDERSLTVCRFPNSENGSSQAARRQSTPEQHSKAEHASSDFLSASVSSPGYLSHASDSGKHNIILLAFFDLIGRDVVIGTLLVKNWLTI